MPCTRNPNGDRMEYTTADSFTRDTLLGARLRDSGTCISSVAWSDFHAPRTDAPVRFAVVRWPSRDGARMDRLTCIRPQWSRPVNRHPVRFPA